MSDRKLVNITVYDDLICPNCYIAYYELGIAIRYAKEHLPLTFNITYRPLRLICPEVLPEGASLDKLEFLSNKFGKDNFASFQENVKAWADKRGLNLTFDAKLTSSTNAFRLSLKAFELRGKMAQYPLHAALFKAHLSDAKDLSDINLLADIAAETHIMSREDALKFLESDELKEEVHKRCKEARANGVKVVPTVEIDGKWRIEGAQCNTFYATFFQKIANQTPSAAPSPMPPTRSLPAAPQQQSILGVASA